MILGFRRGKLVLLVVSGVTPLLCGLLVLYGLWGADQTSAFLAALSEAKGRESPSMALNLWAAENVAGIPFTFVAPVCALYRWSGSRSMAANLLACIANWRWVLVTTAVFALADRLLVMMLHQGAELALLALAGVLALQMFSLTWTLALARRAFPPA